MQKFKSASESTQIDVETKALLHAPTASKLSNFVSSSELTQNNVQTKALLHVPSKLSNFNSSSSLSNTTASLTIFLEHLSRDEQCGAGLNGMVLIAEDYEQHNKEKSANDTSDNEEQMPEVMEPLKYTWKRYAVEHFQDPFKCKPSSFAETISRMIRPPPTIEEMQRHGSTPLKASLTLTPTSELSWMGPKAFRKILSYMGDRMSSKPPSVHAHELVAMALGAPEYVRDELYVQTMKQCTDSPDPTSLVRGWQLLGIFTGQFPPSAALTPYLRRFHRDAIERYNQTSEVGAFARYSMKNLRAIFENGARVHACTEIEIESFQKRQPVILTIFHSLIEENTFRVAAESHTTAAGVCRALATQIGISNHQHFGLVAEVTRASKRGKPRKTVYRSIADYEKVLDVLAEQDELTNQENEEKPDHEQGDDVDANDEDDDDDDDGVENPGLMKKGGGGVNDGDDEFGFNQSLPALKRQFTTDNMNDLVAAEVGNIRLLFQARLFLRQFALALSDGELSLHFVRNVRDVIAGWYPTEEKDLLQLGALQLHAMYGDSPSHEYSQSWMQGACHLFVPADLYQKRSKAFLITRLKTEREKFSMLSTREAQMYYLRYLERWETYGSTFFSAIKVAPSRTMHDEAMIVAVSERGFHLIDLHTRQQKQSFTYNRIKTFGDHHRSQFLIAAGSEHHEFRFTFKTSHAPEIHDLLNDYISVLTMFYVNDD